MEAAPATQGSVQGAARGLGHPRVHVRTEIGFAHALASAWPSKRIGIVKQAVGGTGIMAWSPQWNRLDADITGDAHKGPLYKELVSKALAARAAENAEIRGFLWLQGAKDMRETAAATRYLENLQQLVAALRRDLGTPDLPVLIGSYRPSGIPDSLEGLEPSDFEFGDGRPGAWQVLLARRRPHRASHTPRL